jgi:hypothetical protein
MAGVSNPKLKRLPVALRFWRFCPACNSVQGLTVNLATLASVAIEIV